ncbi:MAG TPA: EAL domain-containing protein [Solirubrobacteraceae bacterium]|nr:EAL domain-containing protein [Solirubrobacteraceae bacterium]
MQPAIDSQRTGEGAVAIDRQRIVRLFQTSSDLLATITPEGRFTLLNPAWSETLGWRAEELLGRGLHELVHPDDVAQTSAVLLAGRDRTAQISNFTNRYRHRDGSWRWLLWSARSEGGVWYAAAKDVTERIWLERQALHDPLTKLPNRLLLMDRARHALRRLPRSGGLVALLFVDLDRFKAVNDSLGHALGDHLLVTLASRLAELMRNSDTIARLGGDEFVILAEELRSDVEALSVAERVLRTLEKPFVVGSTEICMPASIGVSSSHDPEADPEALLREADVAMYRAKRAGGNRLEVFDERLRREAANHREIEQRLRQALPRCEFSLAYQPVFALAGQDDEERCETKLCEALLRWSPDDGDSVTPGALLSHTQQSGLLVQIGQWVLDAACAQLAAWRKQGCDVAVSINVSSHGLAEVDLAARVRAALELHGLPASALWVEVSEQSILVDPERARATLERLRATGVRLALDRAGSGDTRLALIGQMPFDAVKLDRALIAKRARDPRARAVALALVAWARASGRQTVAVGIETAAQLSLARELGCTHAQGFLLGTPRPARELSL